MMFVLACTVASLAQDGTNAYNYLSVPVSSHVYAVGGHNLTIIDDDINLVEQNPALMGGEIDKQVGLNYMRYLGGSNFMGARYGQGIGEHGAFAVGIGRVRMQVIDHLKIVDGHLVCVLLVADLDLGKRLSLTDDPDFRFQ